MKRLPWLVLAFVLTAPAPARGGDDPLLDAELNLKRAAALQRTLAYEKTLLADPRANKPSDEPRLADALKGSGLLAGSRDALGKALARAKAAVEEEERRAETAWREAARRKQDVEGRKKQAEARLGGPLGEEARLVPRGSLFWLWSALALAAGLVLSAYEARRLLRQRWRSATPGERALALIVLLALLGLCLWGSWEQVVEFRRTDTPDSPTEDRDAEQGRIDRKKQKIDESNALLQNEIASQRERIILAWKDELSFPDRAAFLEFAGDHFGELRALVTSARTARALAEDAAERIAAADKLDEEIDDALERSSWLKQGRAALGAVVALISLSTWLAVRLWARRRFRKDVGRCPRCLDGKRFVRDGDFAVCRSCPYRFPAIYRRWPRLCFLTHGVTGSGKTLWLLSSYFLISRRNVPAPVTLELIPSPCSERIDAEVTALYERRQAPGGTPYEEGELPQPLLFCFRDGDPGHGGLLLNLFDFAGEMTRRGIDVSRVRRRALEMEGVAVVLDPTWPAHPDPRQRSVEPQRQAFERFAAEMRRVRLRAGKSMDVPVAVCLTKLDLIPTQSLYENDSLPWLDELRATDRSGVDLATLRRRSRLACDKLDVLFPGWQIVRALRANFGNNFLFFPLTPAGLEDNETLRNLPAGAESLRGRELVPFGVVEPMLWLLHAQGYRVFE